MRLYNVLKSSLSLTKSELKSYSLAHEIKINGEIMPLSSIVGDADIITIDDKIIEIPKFHYFLYYKPRGVLSTVSYKENSYIHQIPISYKVTPAGRLDKESEGLMILSNDGAFLNELTGDQSIHEKEYIVKVNKIITDEFLINMQKSYFMDNKYTKPAKVKKIDDTTFSIILYEGLYHQIRRLVKICNNSVEELKRIRIGSYHLGSMNPKDFIEFKK